MARMVPPEWENRNDSHAEGLVYRKLRDETPDDWLAAHSVGLTSHKRKPWAEIDFVVIGPFGVLCLEVKGGRISVKDGRWKTNDHVLKESPFSQAGGCSAALHHELADGFPELRKAIVGHGVVLPEVTFKERGPGIDVSLVYDDRDLSTSFQVYLERLAKRWLEFHGRVGERFRPLSRAERTSLLRYVAPSFDLLPTLRARIDTAEAELVQLTGAQARTLRGLRSQDRAIVRGGAGTGKTLLAVDEAARYAASGHRVLLCCRSRNLARYIAEHIEEPLVDVCDYEDLLSSLVDAGDRRRFIPEDAHENDVLAVFLPAEAAEAVTTLGREGSYGALILDEAQDLLLDGALELFDLLLDGGLDRGRWRIFLDHKQNVFSAVDLGQLDRIAGAAETRYDLLDNCRNTPQISATTCMLSAVDPDVALAAEGPDVETRFVLDRREDVGATQLVVAAWLRRGVEAGDIVIVGVDEAAADRISRRWSTEVATLVWLHEPRAGAVRLATAADFKGLEALAVVVVGVRELRHRETLRQMYVACSRARVLLAVILDESARDDFDTRAVEYAQRRMQELPWSL